MKTDLIYRGYAIKNHSINNNAYVVKDVETGFEIFLILEEDFTSIEDIYKKIDQHKKEKK